MSKLIIQMKLCYLKSKWRKKNKHNSTELESIVPIENVFVGIFSYGNIRVITYNRYSQLVIGNLCSVGEKVTFILDAEHNVNTISTFPFKVVIVKMEKNESFSKGNIIVNDDVWIGYGATILSGVHIGQGAVVAAGAVVSKDVPPYAVVGGVPAKVIKYRFEQPVIDYMLTLDYSALTEDLIREHVEDLYTEIDGMELEEMKKLFAWFPKRAM